LRVDYCADVVMAGGADGKRDETLVNRRFPQSCRINPRGKAAMLALPA
jgi:hypothetical protein